ncbi:MAG: carboxypeptidase regulatory-like domain-containing protein [Myxococcaceae bacterium]|nr:carboxypeptidase regulatory-like domain-containing protein [Myxococcaceae bacterium]
MLSSREADLEVLTETTTDAAGRFELPSFGSASALTVLASAVGRTGRTDGLNDVELGETRRFVATVTGAGGEHVEGARLVIASLADGRHEEAMSDADGVATVVGLPQGDEVVALVEAPGFMPWLKRLTTELYEKEVVLEVALVAPRRLTGLVLDGARPVALAEVRLSSAQAELRWSQVTDARGRFGFDELPADEYELEALSVSGRASAAVKLEPLSDRDVVLRLRAGPSLSGVVLDDLGAPIGGARVEVSRDGVARSATTASDGTFSFSHVHAARMWLTASAKGHQALQRGVFRDRGGWLTRVGPALPDVRVVAVIELRLLRVRPLALRVVDAAGAPVPEFEVEVSSSDHAERYDRGDGADGGFVASVPFMPAEVLVDAEGFAPTTRPVDAATRALTVTLEREGRLEGLVLDVERRALNDGVVTLVDARRRRRTVVTDAAGRFLFEGVAAGRHEVEVSASASEPVTPGCDIEEWAPLRAFVDVSASGTTHVEVVARDRARIEGTLTVGDERAWLEASWGDPDGGTSARALLGFDGRAGTRRFCLAGLPAGPVTLSAELTRGGAEISRVVEAPATGVALNAGPLPRVTGTVLHADGRPAHRFSVNGRELTSADGRFDLALTETHLPVMIRAPGYAASLVQPPPRGGDLGRVMLRHGPALRGRVLDARDAAPILGAKVGLVSAEGLELDEAFADSDGWFEFAQAWEGAAGVEVVMYGYQVARAPRAPAGGVLELRLVPVDSPSKPAR